MAEGEERVVDNGYQPVSEREERVDNGYVSLHGHGYGEVHGHYHHCLQR